LSKWAGSLLVLFRFVNLFASNSGSYYSLFLIQPL